MSESVKINSISELHNFLELGKPLHPCISVVKSSTIQSVLDKITIPHTLNLYQVSLSDIGLNTITKYKQSYSLFIFHSCKNLKQH